MTYNRDTTELVTKGAILPDVNDDGEAEDKEIYCGLQDPDQWTGQTVKLTLERVGSPPVTCNNDPNAVADPKFTCTLTSNADLKTITPSTDGISVTATLNDAIESTTTFRCSVEVGTEEDGKATDTKLIYVQKIDVKYWSYDLRVHEKIALGDKLKVSVYDDNAYAVIPGESKCKIGTGTEATLGTDVVVSDTLAAGDVTLSCNLKFESDTTKNQLTKDTHTFRYVSPAITIVAKCTVGQFWDKTPGTQACTDCPDNSFRTDDMSQFEDCRTCPTGQTHTDNKSACKACLGGMILTADNGCQNCPAGTKKEGLTCVPCPAGEYQNGGGATTCDKCAAGQFTASSGSTSCTDCPAGTYSREGAPECTACDAGQESNSDKNGCEACPAGQYLDAYSRTCSACPAGSISAASSTECTKCEAGTMSNVARTECEACKAGHYSGAGSSTCSSCPPGTYSAAGASECTPCEKGKYNDAEEQELCKPCEQSKNQYAAVTGSLSCLTCQGTISGDECTECIAGQKYDNGVGQCTDCEAGKVSEAGSGSCTLCPQGTKKVGNVCQECGKGEKQPLAGQKECVPCDAAKGEYQTETGSSYCKTTTPGYKLNNGDVKMEQVKCPKNFFSTGGTKKCIECDKTRGEYTDSDGSTYCNICRGQIDSDGNCGATTCGEDTITLKGIGTGTFKFLETNVGITASVKCADGAEEMITRYCSYNPATREGDWTPADSSKCKSAFTEAVVNSTKVLDDVDVTDEVESTKAVKSINSLAQNATKMAPQDLVNIANSLKTFSSKASSENVTLTGEQGENIANAVGSVAGAGDEKLSSVSSTDMKTMRDSVVEVTSQLPDSTPVETETIAMQKYSLAEVQEKDEPIELPKPKKDTLSAPKLKMNKVSDADGKAIAPTVAVFDIATAKAIFPKPSASADDTASSDTEDTGTKSQNVTYSIDSSIVSLEFKDANELDIEIEIPVDVSADADKSHFELTRICKFYDEVAEEWSAKGCVTLEGSTTGTVEKSFKCQCNHNTSFAIILSEAEIADTIQSTVSTALNIINIVFLGLTFLCIAPFKQFRSRRLIQIQAQLCVALFIGHVSFILLGTTTASNPACTPGVIIVQYLFLVAVAWSVCASVTLYEKIVNALKSFGKQDKHYMVKCVAGCWTAPLFMVLSAYITSLAMKEIPYVSSTGELDDDKTETCWVASPWKWVGFCIPVYLCLGVNVVLFVMIARIIIRAGKSGSSTGHAREVKAIMSIAITVCLPWLVALLMTGPPAMAQVFQWIFIIVTALQGPTMFVCYVIFQEDVLTNLFKLFGQEPPQALLPAKSSKSTKSAASETSNVKPTTAAVKKEEKSDIVQVKNPEYNNPVQEQRPSEENIYSKVDEEAPAAQPDDTISRGSRGSKHMYESTSFTQHGDKEDSINPVPAVEQGETYENSTANDLDIAQNSYPHVPQLV